MAGGACVSSPDLSGPPVSIVGGGMAWVPHLHQCKRDQTASDTQLGHHGWTHLTL
jgi:hypothetical protein